MPGDLISPKAGQHKVLTCFDNVMMTKGGELMLVILTSNESFEMTVLYDDMVCKCFPHYIDVICY